MESSFVSEIIKSHKELVEDFRPINIVGRTTGGYEEAFGWSTYISYSDIMADKAVFRKFAPAHINLPYYLTTSCRCFGRTPDKCPYDRYSQNRDKHISYYLDVVNLFSFGYTLFAKAIFNPQVWIDYEAFLKEVDQKIQTPSPATSDAFMKDSNKADIVKAFTGIYALTIIMNADKRVETSMRLEALARFHLYDPYGGYFLKIGSLWYGSRYENSYVNLLPNTFNPAHTVHKTYTSNEFYNNPTISQLFGNLWVRDDKVLLRSLNKLLSVYKQETLQIINSFLLLDIHSAVTLSFLFSIANVDKQDLDIIFGQHASICNNRMVKIISQTSKPLSASTSNADYLFLKIMIDNDTDYKGYFDILGFTLYDKQEKIDTFLEAHYKALSIRYHPDKNPNESNGVKQKLLNTAMSIFRDRNQRDAYIQECINRARYLSKDSI